MGPEINGLLKALFDRSVMRHTDTNKQARPKMTVYANLAEPRFRLQLMRDTVTALRDADTLWYPLLNVITALVDGLASAPRGKTRAAFIAYVEAHLPKLHAAVGAEQFYEHYRNPAIHEYALRGNHAIGRDAGMPGRYFEAQSVPGIHGVTKVLNIDMLTEEFLAHLDALLAGT